MKDEQSEKVSNMSMVDDRVIRVRFNADVASSMRWNFRPQQTEVKVFIFVFTSLHSSLYLPAVKKGITYVSKLICFVFFKNLIFLQQN